MKNLMIGAMLALSTCIPMTQSHAQVRLSVNLGTPVTSTNWYNSDADYYYLPEQGIYYNTSRRVYVFPDNNGGWVYSSRLPDRYRGYSWQRSHYVRVRESAPFMHHDEYARHFDRGYRGQHVEWRRGGDNHDRNMGHDHDRDRNYNNDRDHSHDRDGDHRH